MKNGKSYSEAGKLGAIASLKTYNEKKQKRKEYKMNFQQYCSKCGSVMELKIGIGYIYYWKCPKNCFQQETHYTTNTNNEEKKETPIYSNHSGV